MANRGKAVVDPEVVRRELEAKEERRRIEENLRQWWETQRGITFDLPVPEECFAPHIAAPLHLGGDPGHHHSPTRIVTQPEASTSRAIGREFSSFPPIQPPLIPVATDRVSIADMRQFWRQIPAPDRTEQEPWYRLANGFVRFRHGESWDIINREERAYAGRREAARNQGIPVLEEPPPPRLDERILRVIEEEDENDDDDPIDGSRRSEMSQRMIMRKKMKMRTRKRTRKRMRKRMRMTTFPIGPILVPLPRNPLRSPRVVGTILEGRGPRGYLGRRG